MMNNIKNIIRHMKSTTVFLFFTIGVVCVALFITDMYRSYTIGFLFGAFTVGLLADLE